MRATEHALRHELPGVLAGRLGRRPDHRPGGAVPGPPRRRAHLLQPGAAVGPGAADLLPVRTQRRRRRLHPELLRHRDHGGGQRLHVPRLAADGRDGDRRADHPRGDGRRAHARHGVGLRRQPRRRRRRRHRAGQGRARLPAADLARRARRPTRPAPPVARAHRRARAHVRRPGLRHAHAHRRARRRRELLRGEAAVRARADRRPRAARGPPGRHRRQQPDGARRHAVRRQRRQGRPLHLVVRRLQRPAGVPRRRARLHDRHRGRAPGDHPPRRQDGHRRERGHRARRCR